MSNIVIIYTIIMIFLSNIIINVVTDYKTNKITSQKNFELVEIKIILFYYIVVILAIGVIILESWKNQKHSILSKIIAILNIIFLCTFIDGFLIQSLLNILLMWCVLRIRVLLEYKDRSSIVVDFISLWLVCTCINDILIYINTLMPYYIPVHLTSILIFFNIVFKVILNPINIIISKYFSHKNSLFFLIISLIYLFFNINNLYTIKQLNLNFNLMYSITVIVFYSFIIYKRSKESNSLTIKIFLLNINLMILILIIMSMNSLKYLWIAKILLVDIQLVVLFYFIILNNKYKYAIILSRYIILFILWVNMFFIGIFILLIMLEFNYNCFLIPFTIILVYQTKEVILLNINVK